MSIAWLAIALTTAVPQALRGPTELEASFALDPAASSARPNIYVLLLDGYARVDTLAEMGFDNEPFHAALESRGFAVNRVAEGSYEYTAQVLAAMLHARHLPAMAIDRPSLEVDQRRLLGSLINDAPVLDEFRGIGYRIITSAPDDSYLALRTADEFLLEGYPNEFEYHLFHETELDRASGLIGPDLPWEMYHDRVVSQFAHLSQVASRKRDQPIVMLMHVLSPHAPLVLTANGDVAERPACFPAECRASEISQRWEPEEFATRYAEQVQAVNGMVLQALDTVLKDRGAVVVIMSDHGTRYVWEDRAEFYRTLFASRTPGHPDAFSDTSYATAIFPVLAATYFGADADPPAFERFTMIDDNLLDLRPLVGRP